MASPALKNNESLPSIYKIGPPEELIKHGLTALRETLPNEQELTTKVKRLNVFEYSL